ncbi:MAG TPA: hypothetical protein VJU15_06475 [Gemmatimonadales bacterium]|nr:hypothetical protein [Gemmatimonadales bacterium]
MFRLERLGCGLLVVALMGCIDSEGPQIQVDLTQAEFTRPAEGSVTVRFTVHNKGDTYAYFSGCGSPIPLVLQRDNNGTWEEVEEFNTSCTGGAVREQLSLEPGASHLDSIPVTDVDQYRLNVWFGSSISEPYAYAVSSGAFQVH